MDDPEVRADVTGMRFQVEIVRGIRLAGILLAVLLLCVTVYRIFGAGRAAKREPVGAGREAAPAPAATQTEEPAPQPESSGDLPVVPPPPPLSGNAPRGTPGG